MAHAGLLDRRREFSQQRLRDLGDRLKRVDEVQRLPELCVYATGSFARNEASEHSDIDLFFLHPGSSTGRVSRLDELRMFARVIEIGEQLKFPTFSNDGEFLRILYLDDALRMLGGRSDDYENFFTARMLLLLESVPVVNDKRYHDTVDSVVDAYFRDYPDHAEDFRPVFLINDVLRFWKTLCLNYEHRRNKPQHDRSFRRKHEVKNFKLKFSRLMSCFGTVIAVCARPSPITKDDIVALTTASPLERFLKTTNEIKDLTEVRAAVVSDYEWFLNQTELTTDELTSKFDSKEHKTEMFRRAETFGERVYQVLDYFAKRNKYSRYLVV